MKSPAFQFYPTDYLGSQRVQMMTLEEEGAYIRLLSSCWQHGSVPSDPAQAARLIGKGASTTLATTVLTMFMPSSEPGRLVHDRLEAEREKQAAWRDKSAAGGRKSAEMRKGGSTVVKPPYQPNGNIPSPSPSPSPSSVSVSKHIHTPPAEGKSVIQLQIDSFFNRRSSTPWGKAELRAFAANSRPIQATPPEDWSLLAWFYKIPYEGTYRRKDVASLLNNWNAEIDRARAHKAKVEPPPKEAFVTPQEPPNGYTPPAPRPQTALEWASSP